MRVLFLDVDGVLNRHDWNDEAGSNNLSSWCVRQLNRVLSVTQAKVVVTSAWRYIILGNDMTLKGFSYMLRTHGVTKDIDIVGVTCSDEQIPRRGDQITRWIRDSGDVAQYCVVDDGGTKEDGAWDDLGIGQHPCVFVDGQRGLTQQDADNVIGLLGAS